MWRDFHLIREEGADILFFPVTYRLFRVGKQEGDEISLFLSGMTKTPPGGAVLKIIEAEFEKAIAEVMPTSDVMRHSWGETDSLCLYVAHDCNLDCSYCYNDRGRNHHPGLMMAPEIAEAAFRRFFITPGKQYAAAFYGGEPLLNFRGIKEIVAIGKRLEQERNLRISFSMTTNGTLLNREIEDFARRYLSSITVSIDGPKTIHDRYRCGSKGGSYERVVANLERLKGSGRPRITLKGTLGRESVGLYRESLAHLQGLGTDGITLTPVVGQGESEAELTDADYDRFVTQHETLNAAAVESGFSGDSYLPEEAVNVVANLLTKRKLRRHCNAGRDLAVTADGSLYACHGLVGQPEFFMGPVDGSDETAFKRVQSLFSNLDVDQLPQCANCWARYFCGGSCYANAFGVAGSVTAPEPRHCMLVKRCAETVIRSFLTIASRESIRKSLYDNMRRHIGAAESHPHA